MGTLRLSGGTLRSRRVTAPDGRAVRPTPARVKEALFSIIAGHIAGAQVLDLFAGSGALGFEALSRGAAQATFVESDRATAATLSASARELGLSDRVTVICARAERSAARIGGRYDLVFADPPYAQPFPAALFATLRTSGAVDAATLVVYEHSASVAAPTDPHFTLVRSARYGAVALAFLHVAA